MTLLRIARFEVARRLRAPSTYVYCALFFAIAFFWVTAAGGGIKGASVDFGASAKVNVNAPYAFTLLALLTGLFGTTITAAFAGGATYQDVEHRTAPLFFTAPITKLDYLGGRWLGAFASTLLLYPWIALGAFAAAHTSLVDHGRVGPDGALAYAAPFVTILLPNLVLTSSLFFALATIFRRMLPVYVASIVLVLGYLVALQMTGDISARPLAALLDPFGSNAIDRITEYWTVAEKNARLVPFAAPLAYNRALWLGVSLALLGLAYARFSFTAGAARARDEEPAPARAPAAPPAITLDFSNGAMLRAMLGLARLQLKETVKSVFFLVVLVAAAIFVIIAAADVDQILGTRTWPVTYNVLEVVGGTFGLFVVILIAFYSGELVWRERDLRLSPIFDALPVPRWVFFGGKLLALLALMVVLVLAVMAAGIALQLARGYHELEIGLYLRWLFGIRLVAFFVLCAIAMFVHVVVDNKYVGHVVMILYFVVGLVLPLVGLEHHLYRVGALPDFKYSAMNGFGPFVAPLVAYEAYWGAFALTLVLVANALWVRGATGGLAARLRAARFPRRALAASLSAFVAIGAFIFYETTIVNRFESRRSREAEEAEFEKTYKAAWEKAPAPKIRAIKLAIDFFPEARKVTIGGTYELENATGTTVARLPITLPREARAIKLGFGRGETRSVVDDRLGVWVYDFPQPLAPGDKAALSFELTYESEGFKDTETTRIVENGTFLRPDALPIVGYDDAREIVDDATREKYALAPRVAAPQGDPFASKRNYGVSEADWVDLDVTLSTSPDQIAIGTGRLVREWMEGGRRHFQYRPDGKVMVFTSFISARYAVRRDAWNDVAIEIDHHPGHTYDVDRMIKAIKRSLDYYTARFGPYQHHQVRVVEFPRYDRFAQADPGVVPFSESIGFIARVDDTKPDEIDYPFYVTAHEVAHMWWGHQVVSANVQGATLLSESLAQYSALMVMKHEYGPLAMKKFLRYELDRYLRGRSTAKRPERPLVLVENEPYIHYAKGSLAMYALQDYIGEDAVNAALAKIVREWAYRPYPDARVLVAELRAVTPPEYAYAIDDLFERITLYENRATRATSTRRQDGKYEITIEVATKKLRASELGAETEVPFADHVDVGAVDAAGNVLALERERIEGAGATFTIVTDALPEKAGIDPLGKLIDRFPDDNMVKVEPAP